MTEDHEAEAQRLQRAKNIFEFLGRAQQLKSSPVRSTANYQSTLWLSDLIDHPAIITSHRAAGQDPEGALFSIDRVPRPAAPEMPTHVVAWVDGAADDAERPPRLLESVPAARAPHLQPRETEEGPTTEVLLEDHPDVSADFEAWLGRWQSWSDEELRDRPIRDLYNILFSTHVTSTTHNEEFELVLGTACLAWSPDQHPSVSRHLITCPVTIDFDDASGRLTARREVALDAISVELDMLDPGLIRNPARVNEIKNSASDFDAHPLDREAVGALARRLVHTLDADGEYRDEDVAPRAAANALSAFAPALILRKRSQQGLVDIFTTIVSQLSEATEVPAGLLPLVDPDRDAATASVSGHSDGAAVTIDDELFLPLPVNDRQRQVLMSVDNKAQTVVQGPPGTGKTHTAAALLSHLLAQGKRVLVAAHTDRALQEVRHKLPEAIKPLSVAVVGTSRSDMADLKTAVERIASVASEHDPAEAVRQIEATLDNIDTLRRQRAATRHKLLQARQDEVAGRSHGPYDGTLAGIAQRFQADASDFGWIADLVEVPPSSNPPLTNEQLVALRALLTNAELINDEGDAQARLVGLDTLLSPPDFGAAVDREIAAQGNAQQHAALDEHEALATVLQLDPATRADVQGRMKALAEEAGALQTRRETWMGEAVFDVRAGRGGPWQARATDINGLIQQARPLVEAIGLLTQVTVTGGELPALVVMANNLRQHLMSGGTVKTAGDGTPKVGVLSPKPVKDAVALFQHVRIDGLAPTREEQLSLFLNFVEAQRITDALDRAWPATVVIPEEDTLAERLQWHVTEVAQLERVLALGQALSEAEHLLQSLGVKPPAWTDLGSVHTYATLVDAAAAKDALAEASQPLDDLLERLAEVVRWDDAATSVVELSDAAARRDSSAYSRAYRRLERLHEVRQLTRRRDEWTATLRAAAPDLAAALLGAPEDPEWATRLSRFDEAWPWGATGSWILGQETVDVNALQAQVTLCEARIRREVEVLAAHRAWAHAVSPTRLTGQAKADLANYAFLVRRLGKGTGKYAAQRRAEIRTAMDRCRTAVPVWIMPIYRIAEQFKIHQDMFDVIIVDEASQAGLEATFLQYLAPKIVVIGDDKQVSPSAVGQDQQMLRDLANQYLAEDRYKAAWQDPKRSFFDEALMRYGGVITLVEHRRCVPEIIGFSNRIAYEPDGVRLIPVRQYGADRLDPIKACHITDGYTRGTTAKVNPAEADAIVEQIEKCLADPRYDRLTFGVISLLGPAQAKLIETKLLERVPPEEWVARELRCGDAADFQGSERDVIFLSMVIGPPEEGRRLGALTQESYVQRYSVAASRAKDQMWLFHSVALSDLGNPEDMRFALLDYCYGVINRTASHEDVLTEAVPEDTPVEPFDSLFEQRVYNRLFDRGYTVVPQYPAEGYNIDLVVVGGKGKLAIECDGDAWHGPDAYERDMARQRDLERCGWRFFRIRESLFYVAQAEALSGLWSLLDELDIRPSGWVPDQGNGEETAGVASPEEPTAADLVDDLLGTAPVISPEEIATLGHEGASPSPLANGFTEPFEKSAPDPNQSDGTLRDASSPGTGRHRLEVDNSHDGFAMAGSPLPVADVDAWPVRPDDNEEDLPPTEVNVLSRGTSLAPVATSPLKTSKEPRRLGEPPALSDVTKQGDPLETSTTTLGPYAQFTGTTASLVNGSRQDIRDSLLQVVAAEGPVVGHRLHIAYVRAAGGQRVGKTLASILNTAINSAVRAGALVMDNPLNQAGLKPRTFRLPDQPEVLPRELGPRTLDHVPPAELAELLRQAAMTQGWVNPEALYRDVLARLGLVRLTTNVEEVLASCLALAKSLEFRNYLDT